jgi:hypothetical protein
VSLLLCRSEALSWSINAFKDSFVHAIQVLR